MSRVTIGLPGAFASFFEGTSVAAGESGTGYPGADDLRAAWNTREVRRVGKGRTHVLSLNLAPDRLAAVLDCLDDYADTSVDGAVAARAATSSTYDREDYLALTAEISAGRTVRKRIAELRKAAAL